MVWSGFVIVWKATELKVGRCQPSFTAVNIQKHFSFSTGFLVVSSSPSPLFQNLEESRNKIFISVVRPSRATSFPVHSDWTWRSVTQSGWLRPPMLLLLSSAINKFSRWPLKDGDAGSRTSNVPGPCRSHYRNQPHTLPCSERMESRDEPISKVQAFLLLFTAHGAAEWTRLKWLLTASGLQRWNFPDSNDDSLKM